MGKTIAFCTAALTISQSSLAAEPVSTFHRHHRQPPFQTRRDGFGEAVAKLTVKAAFDAAAPPTRQDFIAAMLLMSLPPERKI